VFVPNLHRKAGMASKVIPEYCMCVNFLEPELGMAKQFCPLQIRIGIRIYNMVMGSCGADPDPFPDLL
jgi:hypothetical protein